MSHCPASARTLFPKALLLLLAASLASCDDCPDPFELAERVEVRPDERVVLTAPDGGLRVMGRERSAMIEIEARGCRVGQDTRIALDSMGAERLIEVVAPYADVRAWVPAGAEVEILHGSGNVEVRAVGPALIATRAGDVRIAQVVGSVVVQAGPGSLYVREVVGDVKVMHGPGALFIESVMGGVRLRDGSGGIHLREIEGDVVIEGDGGGAIDARDLGGSLTVRAKSADARMIRWTDVAGAVQLPDVVD